MASKVVLTKEDSRPESRGGGDVQMQLCKKCENMMVGNGMSRDSIHSTLAYSRCRCHRLFRYRKQSTQISVAPRASVDETVPNISGRLKSGNNMNRAIKLQPLRPKKTEDVVMAPIFKKRQVIPASTHPLALQPRAETSSRLLNHSTARIKANDGLTSGSTVLPSLSTLSLVSEKPPVGSVVEFLGTSVTRYFIM